uniref:Hsp70-interacting protein N-terminal domain-containing protein n=1 Tax=Ciona savignyi TaxID=51511 RepID=H2ZQB0_CIOSA
MEAMGITKDKLEMLEQFITLLKFNSSFLHSEELRFLKDWLVNDLKATLPDPPNDKSNGDKPTYVDAASGKPAWTKEESSESDEEEEEDESDIEIDNEGVIPGDNDAPQDMGDDSKEATEEEQEEAMKMRQLGMEALGNGDNEGAVTHFTAGIKLDNTKTVLFAKRGLSFLRMQKPNAAIRDANKALQINPDSAAAYKVLGKAQKLLGKWEESCHNFEVAQKIDYDDEIHDLLKEIKPKAMKIREHEMARERKRKEKEIAARIKRVKKAQKAQAKAKKEQEEREKADAERLRKEMPDMFKFAGAQGMPDFASFAKQQNGKTDDVQEDKMDETEDEPKIFEVPTDIDLD